MNGGTEEVFLFANKVNCCGKKEDSGCNKHAQFPSKACVFFHLV
jgi:hypothetical protein